MQRITDLHIKDAQACIIVYSVTSKASFDDADKFRDKFRKSFLLEQNVNHKNALFLTNKGKIRHMNGDDFPFFESSAKKGINVQEPFVAALKLILSNKHNEKSKK